VADTDTQDINVRIRQAIGAQIRRARKARGWTRPQLVAALNQDSGLMTSTKYLTKWEYGDRKPGDVWGPVIERVLDLDLRAIEADARATLGGTAAAGEGRLRGLDDTAHASTGGIDASTTLLPATVEPWKLTDTLTRSTISMATVDHMERTAAEYAARYPSTPPDTLLVTVSELLARVDAALRQSLRLKTRQRCIALLGVLCGLAGNLWLDLGRNDRATSFLDVGMLSAQEAEDTDLLAWLLANRSIGPFFANRYAEAVDVLARAEELASVRSTARRKAWIAALRARAAAASGDQERSLAALDRAHRLIDTATQQPKGTDFFDHPRLTGIAGSTYLCMSNPDRAEPLLLQALERRASADAKGRALLTLDLARCRAISQEPEEAVRLALAALDATAGTVVRPIVTRVRAISEALSPWAELGPVQELSDRTRELSCGR
jgi:transcriptional regulator with XRE-family HTH domain